MCNVRKNAANHDGSKSVSHASDRGMIALTNHSPPSASDDTALSSDLRKKGGSALLLSTVYQSEETGLLQALPLNDRVVTFR